LLHSTFPVSEKEMPMQSRVTEYVRLLVFSLLLGCGPVGDVEEQSEVPSDLQTMEKSVTTWRTDQVAEISLYVGPWGTWRQSVYCNPGFWAVGYKMRVESDQGGGDDTALNSVQLLCKSPSGVTEWIMSHEGIWGDWREPAECVGSYLWSAQMKVESPQGKGDDTAANAVKFSCSGGGTITAPGEQRWGSWNDWQSCPPNSAVCGFAIQLEDRQGNGDDTAMNGMRLYCCSL
jgi:hypothetical protein